ncbi:hypothetical protein GCM10027176_31100 [Actinoallomurus bryophytorum]
MFDGDGLDQVPRERRTDLARCGWRVFCHSSSVPSTVKVWVVSPHSTQMVPTPSKTNNASGAWQVGQVRCVTHEEGSTAGHGAGAGSW